MTQEGTSATSVQTATCTQQHLLLKSPTKLEQPKEIFRLDYKPSNFLIDKVYLDIDLHDHNTEVRAELTMRRRADTPPVDLRLDAEAMRVQSVSVNGNAINETTEFQISSKYFDVTTTDMLISKDCLPEKSDEEFLLKTFVKIDPATNFQLMGLYRSGALFITQCEAEGFRRITPFIDRPDIMSDYKVKLTADKAKNAVLLSNGNQLETGVCPTDPNRHYAVFVDPHKKPCYLFALVAGDMKSVFGQYVTNSGKKIHVEIWSEPEVCDKLMWALHSVFYSMEWDEVVCGREYDLEEFHVVCCHDFNMGAMENKGLNIFNSALLLADPKTTTDAEYQRILNVIGHEYFHNWSGNRVTLRDWFQLTLKEGLTVYRDQLFTSAMGDPKLTPIGHKSCVASPMEPKSKDRTGRFYENVYICVEETSRLKPLCTSPLYTPSSIKRIEDIILLKSRQFQEDASPLAHPIRPQSYISMDNFYTATVYDKGAEVINMCNILVTSGQPRGFGVFRDVLCNYFKNYDGQAVTCENWISSVQTHGNKDMTQFMSWYEQAGTPVVEVLESSYDGPKRQITITLQQTLPAPPAAVKNQTDTHTKPFHIPILVGLIGKQSKKDLLTPPNKLLELTKPKQTFVIEDVSEEPVVSFLRNFSAPVKLYYNQQTDDDLAFLVAHDSDPINKWFSSQQLTSKVILRRAQELIDVCQSIKDPRLCDSCAPENVEKCLGMVTELPPLLVDGMRECLKIKDNPCKDLSLQAYTLRMPDRGTLLQEMVQVDPICLHMAVSTARLELSKKLEMELYDVYEHLTELTKVDPQNKSPDFDIRVMARRRMRNCVLSYIAAKKNDQKVIDLLEKHYKSAMNMTDRQAAIMLLADIDTPVTTNALDDFYKSANGDALVIDKWFTIQALADRDDCTEKVKELQKHEDFNKKNPNRLRSLIFTFARNTSKFHCIDGSGYCLLADCVIEVDAFNPQIAARACGYLINWQKFDSIRKGLMINELKRIKATAGLSKDTLEITLKGLLDHA